MYSVGSVKLSKWQLALLFGAPMAVGLSAYVYNKYRRPDETSQASSKDIAAAKAKKAKATADAKAAQQRQATKDSNAISSTDAGTTGTELERKLKNVEENIEVPTPLKMATMFKNEGNSCYRNGKYDEAISFYDKAIEKCPKDKPGDLAIFYQNRAAAYDMLKKWSKVKEDCSRSLEHNPRYAKAYYRRARAHEATDCLNECLDDVTATCILEMFQNNNTIMFADRILKETGRLDAEKGVENRVTSLPSHTFIKTYLRSFIEDPLQTIVIPKESETSHGFVRALKAFNEQRYEDVIAACTEEIESSEAESQFKTEALLMRGTFHLLSGSFSDCKSDLDTIVESPNADVIIRVHALIKRASLNVQIEEKDRGLADFDTAEKLLPENPDIFHQRAQILLLLEQVEAAFKEFRRAVELAPNHAIACVQKCYTEYRLSLMTGDHKRLENVLLDFHNAIERFPDCVECYSLLAQVLSDQQQYAKAQRYYEKAMELMPNSPSLLVHQAIMILQWRGDVEKAVALLNKSIEVDPKCELAYETLGTVEVQRANLERAVELFEQAIKYAKSQAEMVHIYSLRNAAIAQINVTRKLGIDMTSISAQAQSGLGTLPEM